MKEQQKINCSRCNRPINVMSWYCCDPEKHYCILCSASKCKYCHLSRANIHKERQNKGLKGSLKKRCTVCNRTEESSSQPFFQQEKCKQFYCHSCLLVFYQNNYRMVESLKQQHGQAPLIDVELKCGCEIDKKKIIEYVKKYCFYCSGKMQAPGIKMKNQCSIMIACFSDAQRQSKRKLMDRQKQRKIKSIFNQIRQLLYECDSCKKPIEGQVLTVDQLALCRYCYKFAQYAQKQYNPKPSNKKEEKIENQKEAVKIEKKAQLKCQLCNKDIHELMGQNRICLKCYCEIQGEDNYIQIKSPLQSLIKKQNQLIKKQKQKQKQKEKEKEKQRSKQQQQQIQGKNGKQRLQIIKQKVKVYEPQIEIVNQQQSNVKDPKEINFKLDQVIQKQHKQSHIVYDKDKPNQNSYQSISNIDQFDQVGTFTLKYSIPKQKMIECIKCKAFICQQQSFSSYYRDVSNQSTLRVAETEQQILKYKNKDEIKIYCKKCYLDIKKEIRRQQQLKRYSLRQSYSVPKKQKVEVKKQVGYSNVFGRSSIYDDYYSKKYGKKQENPIQKKTLPFKYTQSFKKQQKLQEKIEKHSEFQCSQCRKKITASDLNTNTKICKNCQIAKAQRQLKQKPKDQFLRLKCSKCFKTFIVQQKEMHGKLRYRCKTCQTPLLKS